MGKRLLGQWVFWSRRKNIHAELENEGRECCAEGKLLTFVQGEVKKAYDVNIFNIHQ